MKVISKIITAICVTAFSSVAVAKGPMPPTKEKVVDTIRQELEICPMFKANNIQVTGYKGIDKQEGQTVHIYSYTATVVFKPTQKLRNDIIQGVKAGAYDNLEDKFPDECSPWNPMQHPLGTVTTTFNGDDQESFERQYGFLTEGWVFDINELIAVGK